MSEPVCAFNVLFGADGTQLPDPPPVRFDPLAGPVRNPWLDVPQPPTVPLPPVPDGRGMHAPIAAVYGEDPHARALRPSRPRPPTPQSRVPPPPRSSALPRERAGQDRAPRPRRQWLDPASRSRSRSDSGVRTGCVIALIIIGVIAFNIIAAIVQAISALFS